MSHTMLDSNHTYTQPTPNGHSILCAHKRATIESARVKRTCECKWWCMENECVTRRSQAQICYVEQSNNMKFYWKHYAYIDWAVLLSVCVWTERSSSLLSLKISSETYANGKNCHQHHLSLLISNANCIPNIVSLQRSVHLFSLHSLFIFRWFFQNEQLVYLTASLAHFPLNCRLLNFAYKYLLLFWLKTCVVPCL